MSENSRSRAAIAATVLCIALASGGWLLGRGLVVSSPSARGARLFDEVVQRVQQSYVDSLDTPELFRKALTGMLRELGDPNTVYLDSARLARLTEATTGIYTGLGVRFDARDGWPMVLATLSGSPAERAGIVSGDRIVAIDGRSTRGWTDGETRAALRGEAGTDVVLDVERPGQLRRFKARLVRGEIHRTAVRRATMLSAGVGYVDVKVFSDSTEREVLRAVDSLSAAGMRALVLDLRNNPGGLLTQGVAVAELFLDPGQVIVTMRGRQRADDRTYRDSLAQRWPTLPIAVLVDQATASASEIVAGALQDHDRALILGQVSYGKGSAQAVFETEPGGLRVTTARWYTPSGRSIDRMPPAQRTGLEEPTPKRFRTDGGREVFGGGGITPDVTTPEAAQSPAELALQAALGTRVTEFRDALTTFAASPDVRHQVSGPMAPVTPALLEGAWRAIQARGFAVDRRTWDGAAHLIAAFLGREMVRIALGPAAEATRAIAEDALIQDAATRLRAARVPAELLAGLPAPAVSASRP